MALCIVRCEAVVTLSASSCMHCEAKAHAVLSRPQLDNSTTPEQKGLEQVSTPPIAYQYVLRQKSVHRLLEAKGSTVHSQLRLEGFVNYQET